MTNKTYICDGEFEIVRITPDLYDEVEALFETYFMRYENVCIVTKILDSPEATAELKRMLGTVIADGVSFAAKHCETQKVVAICCNKVLNPSKKLTFDELFGTFHTSIMQAISDFLERIETQYDVFKEWQVDCIVEVEFIAIDMNFGRRGLASKVTEHAIEFIRRMSADTLTQEERAQLPLSVREERPQATVSVFSTLFTQKLGEKLGFHCLHRDYYKDLTYNGHTFAESIDPIHEFVTFAGLKF